MVALSNRVHTRLLYDYNCTIHYIKSLNISRCLPRSALHKLSEQCDRKKGEKHEVEDRLSKLPDDIILQILSLLTLKQAVSTSLLSRRWRYLWTLISTSLDFDSGKLYFDKAFSKRTFIRNKDNYSAKFVNWASHVLKVNQSSVVDQIKVCFSLDDSFSEPVESWVMFAMKKRVEILEFNFSSFYGAPQPEPCTFPDVGKLMLGSDNRLKILRLIRVNVSDQVIHHVLMNSPLLEELCLVGSETTSELRIHGDESLKLKHLVLHGCNCLKNLTIFAPNLLSFTYSGPKTEVPFRNTPLLSELFISNHYCKSFLNETPKHLIYFSQLINLTLLLPLEVCMDCDFHEDFPKLNNLKQLEVRAGMVLGYPLGWLTFLIEAAPVLSKFVLKLDFIDTNSMLERSGFWKNEQIGSKKYFHEWLQEIEFVGFIGHGTDFTLAVRLLEMSGVLEKFTLDTRHPGMDMYDPDEISGCFIQPKPSGPDGNMFKGTKKMAHKLKSYVPPGAQFQIILDNVFLS